MMALLNAVQDSVNGTACTGVTVGAAGSNPNLMFLNSTTPTFGLLNGDVIAYGTTTAAGITVSSSHCNVLITNTDSGHGAAVLASFGICTA